jgi:hypothetical protein
VKKRITIVLSILIGTILISASCGINPAYTTFCHTISETSKDTTDWHLAIYLDVKACLSCCEDMEAWQELEQKLPECGGSLSLWAPLDDSVDVAVAMELEGMKTPVRVLSAEMLEALKWKKTRTPIKVLFNNQCKPEKIIGPGSGRIQSKRIVEQLLAKVCSEK